MCTSHRTGQIEQRKVSTLFKFTIPEYSALQAFYVYRDVTHKVYCF